MKEEVVELGTETDVMSMANSNYKIGEKTLELSFENMEIYRNVSNIAKEIKEHSKKKVEPNNQKIMLNKQKTKLIEQKNEMVEQKSKLIENCTKLAEKSVYLANINSVHLQLNLTLAAKWVNAMYDNVIKEEVCNKLYKLKTEITDVKQKMIEVNYRLKESNDTLIGLNAGVSTMIAQDEAQNGMFL